MKEKLVRSTSINTRITWAERNRLAAVAPNGLSEAVRQAIEIFIQCQEQNKSKA